MSRKIHATLRGQDRYFSQRSEYFSSLTSTRSTPHKPPKTSPISRIRYEIPRMRATPPPIQPRSRAHFIITEIQNTHTPRADPKKKRKKKNPKMHAHHHRLLPWRVELDEGGAVLGEGHHIVSRHRGDRGGGEEEEEGEGFELDLGSRHG